MTRETLNLKQAAEHVHLAANDLRHFAQRGEIEAIKRGDDWIFEHRILDEWAQRNLIASEEKSLTAQHQAMMEEHHRADNDAWNVLKFFLPNAIALDLSAKTKAGILRDMTDLADSTGLVYDPEALFKELVAREEAASTAVGNGIALLHPHFHDPYLFEESFIAYGRSLRPIYFGAPNGETTNHFFLICSTDHESHLHMLGRLAVLARKSDLIERLDASASATETLSSIHDCETEFL